MSQEYLARIRVDNRDRRPAEVEEQLLTGDMMLTHTAFLLLQPLTIEVTELAVPVGVFASFLLIFLPEQDFCHPFTLQFLMAQQEVGHPFMAVAGASGIEQRFEL